MPRQASGACLLSGMLRCPRCEGRVSGAGSRRGVHRYGCKAILSLGAAATDQACTFTVNAPTIDAAVLAEVGPLVEAATGDSAALSAALRRAWHTLRSNRGTGERELRIQHLEQVGARARDRLKRAALLFVDEQLDKAGYDLARAEAEHDIEVAEQELRRLRVDRPPTQLPPLETITRAAGGWRKLLETGATPGRGAVLAVLIETIVPEHVGWNAWRAHIAWTPAGEALRSLAAVAAEVAA